MITDRWIDSARGIQLRVDPEQVRPDELADAVNVEMSRPYGSIGVRAGCRSLAALSSVPLGGHPASPLGIAPFGVGTNEVLALAYDEAFRRLWAIYRTGTDGDGDALCRAAVADLVQEAPGFNAGGASEDFKIDGLRIPQAQLLDGRLYVATGSRHANRCVVIDPAGLQLVDSQPDPLRPPVPDLDLQTPADDGLVAVVGFSYRAVFKSSRTQARSAFSDPAATGAIAVAKQVEVTLEGADSVEVWDKIEVYRTTDGGDVWRLLGEIDNPGKGNTAALVDATADDRLSYQTLPRRSGRVPSCRFILPHNDRMLYFCKTDHPFDGSIAYYSEPFAPFNVDPVFNAVAVGRNDGASIVGAFRLFNRVYVIKSNGAIYELADNRPETIYRAVPIVSEGPYACVSHATIREIAGAALWLCPEGVVRFDGERAEIVSLPIDPLIDAVQVAIGQSLETVPTGGAATLGPVNFTFTNTDVVTETYQFEVKFFAGSGNDPNVDDTGLVTTLASATTPSAFRVNGAAMTGLGVAIPPGTPPGQNAIAVTPIYDSLILNTTYYPWVRAWDGTAFTLWQPLDDYTAALVYGAGGADVNWGLAAKFFAVDMYDRDEYWLFVASRGASQLDTRLVLNYQSLGSDGGPAWRRDLVHATAAVWCKGLNLDSGHANASGLVMADAFGCVWVQLEDETYDHRTVGVDLTNELRNGTGLVTKPASVWVLTRTLGEPEFPGAFNALRGQRLVVRDAAGNLYIGVVGTSSASTMSVPWWFEGRVPPLAEAVEFAIGGIPAAAEWFNQDLGAKGLEKNVQHLLLRGVGGECLVDCELRASELCEPITAESLARMRRKAFTVKLGATQKRVPKPIRGKAIGLKLSSWRAGAAWRLAAWGLALQDNPTRS